MSRLLVMPRRDGSRTSLEAAPLRLQGARLLLVTGTGGSGKRIVGNLLVDEHSYVHIDLDNPHANQRFLGNGVDGLRAELEANLEPGQDTVVTWTPSRNGALPFVRLMQECGFDWVWLDGDRGAAFHSYFSARNLDAARFVDPFEADGRFRPVTAVLGEVLEPGPVVQPLPARQRMPRELVAFGRRHCASPARRPSARQARPCGLAGGVAFATAGRGGRVPAGRRLRRERASRAGAGEAGDAARGGHPRQRPEPRRRAARRHARGRAQRLGPPLRRVRRVQADDVVLLVPDGRGRAGVEFRDGRVTRVYTLGRTVGWRSEDGVKVGSYMSNKELHEKSVWRNCTGYSAKLEKSRTPSRRSSRSARWSTASR